MEKKKSQKPLRSSGIARLRLDWKREKYIADLFDLSLQIEAVTVLGKQSPFELLHEPSPGVGVQGGG